MDNIDKHLRRILLDDDKGTASTTRVEHARTIVEKAYIEASQTVPLITLEEWIQGVLKHILEINQQEIDRKYK